MAIRDLIQRKNVPARRDEWLSPFVSLQKEINKMFDDFFSGVLPTKWGREEEETFMPSIDVKEKDKEIIVRAELPGMDAEDIDISVSDDALILRGEKKEEKEEKEGDYYFHELSYGSFHREIPLPAEVDTDKVDAEFKKGVLKIRLPKKPEAQRKAKKIQVKSK